MKLKQIIFLMIAVIIFSSEAYAANHTVTLCGVQFSPLPKKEDNIKSMLNYIESAKKQRLQYDRLSGNFRNALFSEPGRTYKQAEIIPGGSTTSVFSEAARKNDLYIAWESWKKGQGRKKFTSHKSWRGRPDM